ncbi:MAG TPA: lytic transglycosylase domain-containing protein [Thermoleophilaceae bacterium]|nr:lytic transglycosylase domain-containing protein [Thermoleophilaceae bacterium]
MPSVRRSACVALAIALLAVPAAAQADSDPVTGGAIPPQLQQPTGAVPGAPTGGASPGVVADPPKKRKKRRKKPAKPPAPSPAPGPTVADVPADYLRIYKAAADWQGVSWRLLAAIGKNESDHGRSTLPGVHSGLNFANCCAGPMQICKVKSCGKTWQAYAVDVDGDGKWSIYDASDAIYGAARLVHDLETIFGDHAALIMAGYNAGPGNVMHYDGVPPFPETRAYVKRGLAYMVELGGHPHE